MTDDERAIRELLTTWFDATKKGDTATVLSLMTDDVVFMVPGRERFGKEAFQNTSNEMKGVRIDGTSDIQELRVLGDWAYMRTNITVTTTPPSSAAVVGRVTHSRSYAKNPMAGGCWPAMRTS